MGAEDRESGPDWEKSIAGCLAKEGSGR